MLVCAQSVVAAARSVPGTAARA